MAAGNLAAAHGRITTENVDDVVANGILFKTVLPKTNYERPLLKEL